MTMSKKSYSALTESFLGMYKINKINETSNAKLIDWFKIDWFKSLKDI